MRKKWLSQVFSPALNPFLKESNLDLGEGERKKGLILKDPMQTINSLTVNRQIKLAVDQNASGVKIYCRKLDME